MTACAVLFDQARSLRRATRVLNVINNHDVNDKFMKKNICFYFECSMDILQWKILLFICVAAWNLDPTYGKN